VDPAVADEFTLVATMVVLRVDVERLGAHLRVGDAGFPERRAHPLGVLGDGRARRLGAVGGGFDCHADDREVGRGLDGRARTDRRGRVADGAIVAPDSDVRIVGFGVRVPVPVGPGRDAGTGTPREEYQYRDGHRCQCSRSHGRGTSFRGISRSEPQTAV